MRLDKRAALAPQGALLAAIAMATAGVAHSQAMTLPTNPAGSSLDYQNIDKFNSINGQQNRDQAQTQAQIARFMAAIKPREGMYPDFDKVVLHGKAPVTPTMLGLMSESPYAADIAYYLGQHPEQSAAIARMQPAQARSAIKQIETAAEATNPIRK